VFDVGFSELMVIAVVALIVIGPERLPKVARTMGHLFGRLQRYVNDVKADIQREMELDELRKFKSTVEEAARSVGSTVQGEIAKTEGEINAIAQIDDPHATPSTVSEHSSEDAATPQPEPGREPKGDPASPAKKTAA
jgi:sec-independent protein translocase protein TatB